MINPRMALVGLILLACTSSNAQLQLQAAVGYEGNVGQYRTDAQIQYTVPGTWIHFGAGEEPTTFKNTFFSYYAGMQVSPDEGFTFLSLDMGTGNKYVSSDDKSQNSKMFLVIAQLERSISSHTYGYLKVAGANHYAALYIGLKYSFVERRSR